jgi:hypothetical protein
MKRISILCLLAGWALLLCACDDDDSPSGPSGTLYRYEDYVHFDTLNVIMGKFHYDLNDPDGKEPVMNWEKSLGEPFFDLDSNGVYDPGIDSFVRALDPAINQDLNRNNRYDGPDEPWERGIPFDDINGDGTYDPDTLDIYSGYEPGMPFCDINENGVRDSGGSSVYGVIRWVDQYDPQSHTHDYTATPAEITYRFVSDSGMTYELLFSSDPFPISFLRTDSGLYDDNLHVLLLDTGLITEKFSRQDGSALMTIDCGASFSIEGLDFTDLVCVRRLVPPGQVPEGHYWAFEYYFSRDRGLLAYGYGTLLAPPLVLDTAKFILYRCYFKPLVGNDSLVFPMTR